MKPILFNTEMVKAILNNQKSVTRRVIKPQPLYIKPDPKNRKPLSFWVGDRWRKAPYQPGDVLYVRETWRLFEGAFGEKEYHYLADETHGNPHCWRPSIHMPKEAARIFLLVTDVRVERLQDITDDDLVRDFCLCEYAIPIDRNGLAKSIWNSTIKKADLDKYGWDANPWVEVVDFERISREEAMKNEIR